MIKRLEKLSFTALLIIAMIVTTFSFGAKDGYDYLREVSARKNGSLVTQRLSTADFVIDAMRRQQDGSWVTTDGDPKMMYNVGGMFTGIQFKAEYMVYSGDVILYYFTQPGEGFSEKNRLYVAQDKENPLVYSCHMPVTNVVDIRLDPTTIGGNVIDIESIVINPPMSLADYMAPTPHKILTWGICWLLLAGILQFIQEFFTKKFE